MTTVFILLACTGLTFILKYGTILSWVKKPLVKIKFFNDLFQCSLCLGFWSGIIISVFLYFIVPEVWNKIYFLLPLASSVCCWSTDAALGVLQWSEVSLEHENKKHIQKK